ncbi:MAG: tryptophan--tRNA ligase [Magnetovibrio sp.]|nr:tryptophan--tRNA ligase [Magnetovibrio sp.]|tara:strand:+ start:427 stop:1428 length:1002 start_codon:yes stop_codon:yes gene_type:complete
MERIFSGVQPTGNLHLGNYLGAIRNWVKLQNEYEDCIFCVVDMHAITVWQNPSILQSNTRETAATMIAAGVDPKRNIIFNQSQVAAHAELAWIFNCIARIGWLDRMTQFKEKAGKDKERASAGLYVYPNLMAADILVYKGTHVPVGEDQKQHLELARDIASKFNHDYKRDLFPLVEPLIFGPATRVMSLKNGSSKMSKSDPSDLSRINLKDDVDTIARKIKKAKSDTDVLPSESAGLKGRPEAANLVSIYGALAELDITDVLGQYGGRGFGVFKPALTELAIAKLTPIQEELKRLMSDQTSLDCLLKSGADRARSITDPIIAEVKEIVGFIKP